MFNNFNALDWQYVESTPIMGHPLDAENGSQVDLQIYSDKTVRVHLITPEGDTFPLSEQEHTHLNLLLFGYDRIELRTSPSNKYAVKLFVTDHASGEQNNGEQAVLQPLEDSDLIMNREVQHAVIRELSALGMDQTDILDVMEGLNSNDDDLEFEDESILPTEAEMDDLIQTAQLNAQLEVEDDPPETDTKTKVDDDPPNHEET